MSFVLNQDDTENIEDAIVCNYGQWQIRGACLQDAVANLPDGVELETTHAIQVDLVLDWSAVEQAVADSGAEQDVPVMNYDWAVENEQAFADAVVRLLEVDESSVMIQIIPRSEVVEEGSGFILMEAGNRRLQASLSENAFGVRVLLLTEDDPSILSQSEAAAGANSSTILAPAFKEKLDRLIEGQSQSGNSSAESSASPLMVALRQKLVEEDQLVPLGLDSTTVQNEVTYETLDQYVVPKNKWVLGPWETCDTTCGEGTQSRTVVCPRSATGACTGKEPPHIQPCSNYEACEFDPLCPMGPPCEQQAAGTLGIFAAIIFCCCLACFRRLQVMCRPPTQGQIHLEDNVKAKWMLRKLSNEELTELHASQNASVSSTEYRSSQGSSSTTTDSIQSTEVLRQSSASASFFGRHPKEKTAVIWDLDPKVLESFANPTPQEEPANNDADILNREVTLEIQDPDDADIDEIAQKYMLALSSTTTDLERYEMQLELIKENNMMPIMVDQSRIEYFSVTNRQWILATLHVTMFFKDSLSRPTLSYRVTFPRMGKDRTDVMVDCFRSPFAMAEPIDIFSKREEGAWIPGVIKGKPPPWAVTVGYRVSLEHEDMILDNVPPGRLRRRFPPGCPCLVYRGVERGWVRAMVHMQADTSDISVPPLGNFSPGGAQAHAEYSLALRYWVNVPIIEMEWHSEDEAELVPSYFVQLISDAQGDDPRSPVSPRSTGSCVELV
jgi:hypothetical protein